MKFLLLFLPSLCIAMVCHYFAGRDTGERYLVWVMEQDHPSIVQVFWDEGSGWNEEHSTSLSYQHTGGRQYFRVELPSQSYAIRLDPTHIQGLHIALYAAVLVDSQGRMVERVNLGSPSAHHDIDEIHVDDPVIRFRSTSDDSQLVFPFSRPVSELNAFHSNNLFPGSTKDWVRILLITGLLASLFSTVYRVATLQKSRIEADGKILIVGFCALLVIAAALWGTFTLSYFYLLDDFPVLRIAQSHSFYDLFNKAHIGFYRPIVFVLFKVQMALYGWENPHLFAIGSLVMHAINCLLVAWWILCLFESRKLAVIAAILYFVNPWAGESPLWFCLQGDLAAVSGCLIVLILGHRKNGPFVMWRDGIMIPSIMAIAALFAYFAKESALTLPAIFGLLLCIKTPVLDVLKNPRTWIHLAAITVPLLLYMKVRSQMLGAFGGAYGNYFDLLHDLQPQYLLHPFWNPALIFDGDWLGGWVRPIHWILLAALMVPLLIRCPFRTLLYAAALAFALLPVITFQTAPNSSAGTRWIYLPAIVFVTWLAHGIQLVLTPGNDGLRWTRLRQAVIPVVVLTYGMVLTYLGYQQVQNWSQATALSRFTIERLANLQHSPGYYYVPDFPHQFKEGSVMVASHVFDSYFGPGKGHVFRGELNLLRNTTSGIEVYQILPDRWGASLQSFPNETTFYLGLDSHLLSDSSNNR